MTPWLQFLVPLTVIVWLVMQTRNSRAPVWERRFAAVARHSGPLYRHVKADIRAIRTDIRAWRLQRKVTRRWHL
jgi:hypothetical protein